MNEIVITTYDWVPPAPRGHVRDIRACWALEEAGLPYRVTSTSFADRGAAHLAHQPFAQVPWLTHGGISIFESGAMLLYIGELSDKLMPGDPKGRAAVTQWLFAALNSVEMASLPWWLQDVADDYVPKARPSGWDAFLKLRLDRLEPVLASRQWLAGAFSIADIAMADVLRLPDKLGGLTDYPAARAYVARALARPAFIKAHTDQIARFAKAG